MRSPSAHADCLAPRLPRLPCSSSGRVGPAIVEASSSARLCARERGMVRTILVDSPANNTLSTWKTRSLPHSFQAGSTFNASSLFLAPYGDRPRLISAGAFRHAIVEGDSPLWTGVSEPYKHTVRSFLVHFHFQLLRETNSSSAGPPAPPHGARPLRTAGASGCAAQRRWRASRGS